MREAVKERSASVRTSLIVPAYNEEQRLRVTLPPLVDILRSGDHELLVVDDGSTDATARVAAEYLAGVPHSSVIRLPRNTGKGAAVRVGVARSRGDAVVFMDADLATDLDDLPRLIAALDRAEVAAGSRVAPGACASGSTRTRANMGRTFNRLAHGVLGVKLHDTQCGFKAFRAPAAKLLFHLSVVDGFAFDVEILALANELGLRTEEVPIHWKAVDGSHVRPMLDPLLMTRDVLSTRLQMSRRRHIHAIRLRGPGPADAMAALRPLVRRTDMVLPWPTGAMALLPQATSEWAEHTARRIAMSLPRSDIGLVTVPARALFHPSWTSLRLALAA